MADHHVYHHHHHHQHHIHLHHHLQIYILQSSLSYSSVSLSSSSWSSSSSYHLHHHFHHRYHHHYHHPVSAWRFCPSARHFIHIAALHPARTRFNGTNGRVHFVTYFHVISLLQTFLPCFQFHAFSNFCNQTGWSIYMISPIWYYSSDQSHSKCIQIMKTYLDKQC